MGAWGGPRRGRQSRPGREVLDAVRGTRLRAGIKVILATVWKVDLRRARLQTGKQVRRLS